MDLDWARYEFMKSCIWVGEIPSISTDQRMNGLKTAPLRRAWED